MLSNVRETVAVACPRCGHSQPEPPGGYSTLCKKCGEHYLVQEALFPGAKPSAPGIQQRQVRCFQCGTNLEAPRAAASTMCKRCSSHIDLTDYKISQTVSKSFRTHGRLVVEEKGYLLNTDSVAGEAVLRGRLIGRLVVQHSLEIYSSANIKGSFTAGELVIPAGQDLRWSEPLRVGNADIAGELAARLCASGLVRLRGTAQFFGDIEAAALIVEGGAVFVGGARVGAH